MPPFDFYFVLITLLGSASFPHKFNKGNQAHHYDKPQIDEYIEQDAANHTPAYIHERLFRKRVAFNLQI